MVPVNIYKSTVELCYVESRCIRGLAVPSSNSFDPRPASAFYIPNRIYTHIAGLGSLPVECRGLSTHTSLSFSTRRGSLSAGYSSVWGLFCWTILSFCRSIGLFRLHVMVVLCRITYYTDVCQTQGTGRFDCVILNRTDHETRHQHRYLSILSVPAMMCSAH